MTENVHYKSSDKPNDVSHSIVGIVGDVRREMSGHHYAEVFKMQGVPKIVTF